MCISTFFNFLGSFRKIEWMNQKLLGKNRSFSHFRGILIPLTPWGSKIRFFSGSTVTNIYVKQLCLTFWEVSEKLKWIDQKLWGRNWNFGHFGGILDPFDPPGLKNQIFSGSRVINICVFQLCLTFWEVSEKFNEYIESYGAKIVILEILGYS